MSLNLSDAQFSHLSNGDYSGGTPSHRVNLVPWSSLPDLLTHRVCSGESGQPQPRVSPSLPPQQVGSRLSGLSLSPHFSTRTPRCAARAGSAIPGAGRRWQHRPRGPPPPSSRRRCAGRRPAGSRARRRAGRERPGHAPRRGGRCPAG